MQLYVVDGKSDRIQQTEVFLRRLCGVLDASVWAKNGSVVASVTLASEASYGADELHAACQEEIGSAPHLFMLQRAQRPNRRAAA